MYNNDLDFYLSSLNLKHRGVHPYVAGNSLISILHSVAEQSWKI